MATLAEAQEIKKRHATELMARPGIYGVGVTKDGDEWALAVYVDEQAQDVPIEIEGIKVTTCLSGPITAY